MGDKALNILGLIVAVAAITAIVGGKNSSAVIGSMGTAFSQSIQAALGSSTNTPKK